MKITSSN